ncbi:MAG: hypothetical protein WC343_02850 [Bacilli bacterium]|jgi:hypothetical protein
MNKVVNYFFDEEDPDDIEMLNYYKKTIKRYAPIIAIAWLIAIIL